MSQFVPPYPSLASAMQSSVRFFIETSPNNKATLMRLSREADHRALMARSDPERERWEYNAAQLQRSFAALEAIAHQDIANVDFEVLDQASRLKVILEEFSSVTAMKLNREFAHLPEKNSALDNIEAVKVNMTVTKLKQGLRNLWNAFGEYMRKETDRNRNGIFADIMDSEQITKVKRWVIGPMDELARNLQSDALFAKAKDSGIIPLFVMGDILTDMEQVLRDKRRQDRSQTLSNLVRSYDKDIEPYIKQLKQCCAFGGPPGTIRLVA
jgi:hypothetical protein